MIKDVSYLTHFLIGSYVSQYKLRKMKEIYKVPKQKENVMCE